MKQLDRMCNSVIRSSIPTNLVLSSSANSIARLRTSMNIRYTMPSLSAASCKTRMMDLLLDPTEVRVLGSLLEKEITTPEYYPLSLNALVNACNQKSNRDPAVHYDEGTVEHAL